MGHGVWSVRRAMALPTACDEVMFLAPIYRWGHCNREVNCFFPAPSWEAAKLGALIINKAHVVLLLVIRLKGDLHTRKGIHAPG